MSKETIRIVLEGDVEKAFSLMGTDDDVTLLRKEVARLTADVEQLRADVDKLLTINQRSIVFGGLWAEGLAGG